MKATKLFGAVGVAVGLTVALIAVTGAASADAPVRFHEEFTDVIDDYCDVPGLTVRSDVVVDGKTRIRQTGRFHGTGQRHLRGH